MHFKDFYYHYRYCYLMIYFSLSCFFLSTNRPSFNIKIFLFYFASSYQQTVPNLTSRLMRALDLWCRPCTNNFIPGYSATAGCRHTALAPWGPPAPGPTCGQLLAVLFIAISTGYGLPATIMPLESSCVFLVITLGMSIFYWPYSGYRCHTLEYQVNVMSVCYKILVAYL